MSPAIRSALAHLSVVAVLRVATSILVLRLGFAAVSDDDYARVTIAQAFAALPRLDPSGTSWLPFPFWIHGAVMMVFGASLSVARATSIVAAVAASCALYLVIRTSGSEPRAALAASLGSTLMPISALTGVATVPELPTAVACACALLLLRRYDRAALLGAALFVLPATLSRYEAWPVALVVAAAAWTPRGAASSTRRIPVPFRFAVTATSLAGIASWILWNQLAHGDALRFHTRVAAFWFASGHARGEALSALLRGYPWSALFGVPTLTTLVLGALWIAYQKRTVAAWSRPAAGALLTVISLTALQATGGAPTHHPERTLMLVWMVAWAFAADLLVPSPIVRRAPVLAIGAAALVLALLTHQTTAQARHPETDRRAEERVGQWVYTHAPEGTILLEPADYGYFAILAAARASERVQLSHSIDPRAGAVVSPFEQESTLRSRASEAGARWLVVRSHRSTAAKRVATLVASESGWDILRVD